MTADTPATTAIILQFPTRSRTGFETRPSDARQLAALATRDMPVVDTGAWYHAEAMQTAPRLGKR